MTIGDKVVIVTGGSSGIGGAIATAAARKGAKVAICGRTSGALLERAAALKRERLDVLTCVCDVSDAADVRRFVRQVQNELGPIDVLVNNVGGWLGEPLSVASEERVLSIMQATVYGTLLMTKAVLPDMLARKSGYILNIGSTSGLPGSRDSVAATVPKTAIAGLTAALRQEVRNDSIAVAVLHPGWVASKPDIDPKIEDINPGPGFRAISAMQVADVAMFMIAQPSNVLIREVIMTPLHADI